MCEPETDSWAEGVSEMPVWGHRRVRVWITSSRRGAANGEWDCRATSFSKAQHRAVLQAMSELAVDIGCKRTPWLPNELSPASLTKSLNWGCPVLLCSSLMAAGSPAGGPSPAARPR